MSSPGNTVTLSTSGRELAEEIVAEEVEVLSVPEKGRGQIDEMIRRRIRDLGAQRISPDLLQLAVNHHRQRIVFVGNAEAAHRSKGTLPSNGDSDQV
jgi:hypothetical protein